MRNFVNDENDEFTACIDAECAEKMVSIDPLSAAVEIKNLKKIDFREFWTFERENSGWLLKDVRQFSGWSRLINEQIIFDRLQGTVVTASHTPLHRISDKEKIRNVKFLEQFAVGTLLVAIFCGISFTEFLEPLYMSDAILKTLVLVLPIVYFVYASHWKWLFTLLENSDAKEYLALIVVGGVCVAALLGSSLAVLLVNNFADRSEPMVVTAKVIGKGSYGTKRRVQKVTVELPLMPGCCWISSRSVGLAPSYQEWAKVEVG